MKTISRPVALAAGLAMAVVFAWPFGPQSAGTALAALKKPEPMPEFHKENLKEAEKTSKAEAIKKKEPSGPPLYKDDKEIYRIKGRTYTYGQIKKDLDIIDHSQGYAKGPFDESDKAEVDGAVVQHMIMALTALEGYERGLDKTETFKRQMEIWEIEALPSIYEEKEVNAKINPSDEVLIQYIPIALDEVRVRVVVSGTMEESKKIYDRIKAGEDMAAIALKEGAMLGPDKTGLIPWLNISKTEKFVLPVIQKFLDSPVGTVFEPFHTDIGSVVARVEEKRTGEEIRKAALDKDRDSILAGLRKEEMNRRLEEFKTKYGLKIYEEAVEQFSKNPREQNIALFNVGGKDYKAGRLFERMPASRHSANPLALKTLRMAEMAAVAEEARKLGLDSDPVYLERWKTVAMSRLYYLVLDAEKRDLEEKPPSEAEYDEYFKTRPELLITEDTRCVRYAQFMTEPLAMKALEKLETGMDFQEMAKTMSMHAESAARGGDVGCVPISAFGPDVSKVVFALPEGGYTKKPIQGYTEQGPVFALVQVYDVRKPTPIPRDSAKTRTVTERIRAGKRLKLMENLLNSLQAKFGYENCN